MCSMPGKDTSQQRHDGSFAVASTTPLLAVTAVQLTTQLLLHQSVTHTCGYMDTSNYNTKFAFQLMMS